MADCAASPGRAVPEPVKVQPCKAPQASAGFTLIELLVSLALFALISLAGVGLVETVVGVQQRTDSRAGRLAEVQRALHLITADFAQLTAGPRRDGASVRLDRASGAGDYSVSYRSAADGLHRIANGVDRTILRDAGSVQWRFFRDGAWQDQPTSESLPQRPGAIELVLQLQSGPNRTGGTVRRVVELPAEP
jgi:general secretion pathway protein J